MFIREGIPAKRWYPETSLMGVQTEKSPKNILKMHFPLDSPLQLSRSVCPGHSKFLSSQMTENKNAICFCINNCSCSWGGFEFSIKYISQMLSPLTSMKANIIVEDKTNIFNYILNN